MAAVHQHNGSGNGAAGGGGGIFSRQTFMILSVGILFGYILLPVLMLEMNVEDALGAIPSVSVKYPSSQQAYAEVEKYRSASSVLRSKSASQSPPPPRALDAVGDGQGGASLTAAEKRIVEDRDVLSTQSLPTTTTPYVMKTLRLPDHQRMKILVTGGAGFVGSHLVDKLMMEGHEVTVLDNFFTGQKKNIAHWFHHPNFRSVDLFLCVCVCLRNSFCCICIQFVYIYKEKKGETRVPGFFCFTHAHGFFSLFPSLIQHDVTEQIMLEVDQIYHLACPASPPHYQYNPVKTIKTSTEGTLNMLGLAKRVRARILLTSTSEIYGDPEVHPQPESYWGNVNTIGPRSCYDEGKRVAETMMYSYRNQNAVEIRVARIFNTFGPRMHPNDGRVVSNFIIQALQNKDLTIYGEGEQTRSFQYVSDLVDGLHALMNGDYDLPVNLGNPEEYSIKAFAEYISMLTKTRSKIVNLPKSQDDPGQRRPDISTAKREINWQPKVKVEVGLQKTIDYFKKVLEGAGEIIPTGPGAAKPEA
jgi:UDP-glucuronate decarboxylase